MLGLRPRSELKIAFSISGIRFLSQGDMIKDLPLRRLGSPQEVADTIFYLCSDQSTYVSGTEIEINGGQHV